MALTVQATIAAACYAVVIATAFLSAKDPLSTKALSAAAAAVGAFIGVCVINCYVSGGCGLLAWVFAAILVLAAGGTLVMVYDQARNKRETLVFTGPGAPLASADDNLKRR